MDIKRLWSRFWTWLRSWKLTRATPGAATSPPPGTGAATGPATGASAATPTVAPAAASAASTGPSTAAPAAAAGAPPAGPAGGGAPPPSGHDPEPVMIYPGIYWAVIIGYIILQVLLLLWNWANGYWDPKNTFSVLGIEWNLGSGILLAQLVHLGLSATKYVRTNELGLITFFGKPVNEVGPGWIFIPIGLLFFEKFVVSTQEAQFPDDPEFVQLGDDKIPLQTVTLPDGTVKMKVRPIRVNSGGTETANKSAALNSQMTIVINGVVRYRIQRGYGFAFKIAIGSFEEAERQMRDTWENTAKVQCSTRPPSRIIQDAAAIDAAILINIRSLVRSWGIAIENATMLAPDLSHEVAIALASVTIAKSTADATRAAADASRYKFTEEGEGRAAALKAELTAQGEGNKRIMDEMKVDGRSVLSAQTVQKAVGEGDLIIGTQGVESIMGLVDAGARRFTNRRKKGGPAPAGSTPPPSGPASGTPSGPASAPPSGSTPPASTP